MPPGERVLSALSGTQVPEQRALATALDRFPGRRIEKQLPIKVPIRIKDKIEIEQIRDRPGQRVERLVSDLPQLPIVFDEPRNRSLIGQRMADEIALG
jgi:hypothetical protein